MKRLILLLILALSFAGCTTAGEETARNEVPDTFAITSSAVNQDDLCEFSDGCGDFTPGGACDLTRGGDVLAFIKVEDFAKEYLSCEERPYSESHVEMKIQVLNVIAGDQDFATVQDLNGWYSDRFEVGKIYLVMAMEVDSIWWKNMYYEVTPGTEAGFSTTSEYGTKELFDLPHEREAFIAEVRDAWDNYGDVCESRMERPQLSEQEKKSIIYDKPCLNYPGTGDEMNQNQGDGPQPGDDDY